MKKLISAAIAAAALFAGSSDACFDPLAIYYGGIVLNNEEEIDFRRLEEIAGEGTCIKECFTQVLNDDDDVKSGEANEGVDSQIVSAKVRNTTNESETVELCSYKLRSVYNEDAMVFIGYVEGMFSLFDGMPRLIVYFPVDSNTIPTTEEKASAVAAELNRFSDLGIITMAAETITRARAGLSAAQGQYWAAEDTVLPFNMWFNGGGVNGVRAVDGVKGVSSCGGGVAYELPENELTRVEYSRMSQSAKVNNKIRIEKAGNGVAIHYSMVETNNTVMRIFDMQARVIDEITLERNSSSMRFDNGNAIAPGCYLLSIQDGGNVLQRGIMTLFR